MILFINTSQTDLIQIKLIDKDKVVNQLESREEYRQSELLLGMIDKLIKSKGLSLLAGKAGIKDLKSIAVVSGPGAFSALRLGVATANTLAWSLEVPIVELNVDEVQDDETLIKSISKKKKKEFKLVVPKYGKEPNIAQSNN